MAKRTVNVTEKQKANLIPFTERTVRERKEIAKRGAIASNKAQAEKKTWKMLLETMLAVKPTDDKIKDMLKKYGVKDPNYNAVVVFNGIFKKALQGDKWAIEQLAKITDNQGADKLEVNMPVKIEVKDDYGD